MRDAFAPSESFAPTENFYLSRNFYLVEPLSKSISVAGYVAWMNGCEIWTSLLDEINRLQALELCIVEEIIGKDKME